LRRSKRGLAFLATVVNNPVGTVMRFAFGLAIALGLTFPIAGMAFRQQDPSAPAAPVEQAPAETTAAAGKKAPESVAKEKSDAGSANSGPANGGSASNGSASGSTKSRQRTATAPDGAPRKIVVRKGGATEPAAQIAPDLAPAEAVRQRQNAEQWLGSTDLQLKQLAGRTLSAQQQETVGQIRNYMNGVRSALQEGDVQRANTLAEKAHLLADDLVRH
jgi:hypothetical protein